MSAERARRLVILSGPSCVGKSPLAEALAKHYRDLSDRLVPVCLYNSRPPRPGEVDGEDYHFRRREKIEALRDDDRYVVMEVRGDLQALDLRELEQLFEEGDAFFEGNPAVGRLLQTHPSTQACERLGIFVSPLSRNEIAALLDLPGVDIAELIRDVMRRKLLRRTRRQRGELSLPDLEEVERRCGAAYGELREAHRFRFVLPNHDGEDSEHWTAFPRPVGDAGRTLEAFAAILGGRESAFAETWDSRVLPEPAE